MTVVALPVRVVDGEYQLGSHIPMKAYQENPDTTKRALVQGGIKEGESLEAAMVREIQEECGAKFAAAAQITRAKIPVYFQPAPKYEKLPKCYIPFWAAVPLGVEPQPSQEIYRWFWDDWNDWLNALNCMSEERRKNAEQMTQPLAPLT
jgi:8-oxo-dGTP pyrophosphatase MutT (NUDIX family)